MKEKKTIWQRMGKMTAAVIAAAAVSFTTFPAPAANASWGGVIGGVIGAAVQYQAVDSAMKHYDNEGRQDFFEQVKQSSGVNEDPELNERLDLIMERLTVSIAAVDPTIYDKPYNYFINPDKTFNAFCTLGHNISVNTGMFTLVANDDEIAAVLAHEIVHGQKEHVRKSLKGSLNASILRSVVAGATGINALGTIFANNVSAVHVTKPKEWEADNIAFDYMLASPYNLGAGAALWQRVIDQYGSGAQNFVGDIFSPSDHPSHKERRDNYAKKLAEYSGDKVRVKLKEDVATVYVNDRPLVTPVKLPDMSGNERAYFVLGALSRAFHNGAKGRAYAEDDTVYFGGQAIFTAYAGDASAEDVAATLNAIR